eukprot:gene22298-15276_t
MKLFFNSVVFVSMASVVGGNRQAACSASDLPTEVELSRDASSWDDTNGGRYGTMDEDMRNFPWCADLADGNPWLGTRAGGSSWVSQFNISMKETSSSPLVAADVLVKGLEMPFTGLSAKTKQGEPATYFTASYKDGDFFVSSGYTYATTVRFTPVKLGASDGSNDIDVGGQTYTCARIGLRVCATTTTTTTKTTTVSTTTSETTSTTTTTTSTTTTTAITCEAGQTYSSAQGVCVPYADVLAAYCGAGTVLHGFSCINNASLAARLKEEATEPFDADNGASYCGTATAWDDTQAKCIPAPAWSETSIELGGNKMPLWMLITLGVLLVLLISTFVCCLCACCKCKCFAREPAGLGGAGAPPGVNRRSKRDSESYTNPAWRQSFNGTGPIEAHKPAADTTAPINASSA